jgi:hypothetical protein
MLGFVTGLELGQQLQALRDNGEDGKALRHVHSEDITRARDAAPRVTPTKKPSQTSNPPETPTDMPRKRTRSSSTTSKKPESGSDTENEEESKASEAEKVRALARKTGNCPCKCRCSKKCKHKVLNRKCNGRCRGKCKCKCTSYCRPPCTGNCKCIYVEKVKEPKPKKGKKTKTRARDRTPHTPDRASVQPLTVQLGGAIAVQAAVEDLLQVQKAAAHGIKIADLQRQIEIAEMEAKLRGARGHYG